MKCTACGNDNEENAQFCGVCGTNLISGEVSVGTELPMVRFGEAIRRGFSNYFRFSGRSTRAEYWWWTLFVFVVIFALTVLRNFLEPLAVVSSLFWLGTLLPGLAVGARRLHDIDKSGWYLLLWLFPVIGWIWLGDVPAVKCTPNWHSKSVIPCIKKAFVAAGCCRLVALARTRTPVVVSF